MEDECILNVCRCKINVHWIYGGGRWMYIEYMEVEDECILNYVGVRWMYIEYKEVEDECTFNIWRWKMNVYWMYVGGRWMYIECM